MNYSKRNYENNASYNTTRKSKYFGVNLAKEVKDLSIANYMTLMKEIESYTNNWKDILDL